MLYISTIQTILIRLKIKNTILTLQSFKVKGPIMNLRFILPICIISCVYGISFAQEISNEKTTSFHYSKIFLVTCLSLKIIHYEKDRSHHSNTKI